MKRLYIITGAKGHLASTILRYLRKEPCLIRGLILPTEEGEDDAQITYYKGDVTQPASLEGIFSGTECNETIVIHAAGIVSISDGVTPMLYAANVEGTRNIIAQCERHGVKRLVYVSSVHAIPEAGDKATISETGHFSPESVNGAYAKTKAEATQAVLDAARRGSMPWWCILPASSAPTTAAAITLFSSSTWTFPANCPRAWWADMILWMCATWPRAA